MRTIFVLFDSLNRTALGCYGSKVVKTPNFDRFAARSLTFDNHYVGSLPCMPARRDMHSGRLNFTHRSWGPLEPFDNSFAQLLKENSVYSHLISDHLHYFEDGGTGFHTRFNSYDFIRGQEYDPWIAMVKPPLDRYRKQYSEKHYELTGESYKSKRLQNIKNRGVISKESDFPVVRCFDSAFGFLDQNVNADDWMLMLECFDPHEPFHAPQRFKEAYESGYEGKILDWPHYNRVVESPVEIREIRANYAALVAMCDEYFGKLLDYLDVNNMWEDTAIVLSTDHGFLLSEHDWWGKCRMPYYEEVSHIPLLMWDPRCPSSAGKRTSALTQTADLMPTLLGHHNIGVPPEVRATDLSIHHQQPSNLGRDVAVFGVFGGPIGVTDGRYVYYHYPPKIQGKGLREYTLIPAHMNGYFSIDELSTTELQAPFDFTKGVPVLSIAALPNAKRVPMNDGIGFEDLGHQLFNLKSDPEQKNRLVDKVVIERLITQMITVLKDHDTPIEVFEYYELELQ